MGDGKETGPMIEAEGLAKHYGETRALAGVGFAVAAGTILGLLGPNGAGKTTAVRILTTLALPDAGRATVAGIDVVKHPGQVRRSPRRPGRSTRSQSTASVVLAVFDGVRRWSPAEPWQPTPGG